MQELSDIDLKQLIETETGDRFNRDGFVRCPFHNEKTPSLSVKFFPDKNKYKYTCWGCESRGDAIDFIKNYRNVDYTTARELLGMENEKTEREQQEDQVKEFIAKYKPGEELKGLFTFVNADNEPIYFKAKLVSKEGKKYTPYFSISEGKVIPKRLCEEVPYNYYNLLQGIKANKTVIFLEGEKDVNTINKLLRNRGYVATSLKGVKDFKILTNQAIKQGFVLGDTGAAGEKYIEKIRYEFQYTCQKFKIIKLPGLRAMGDNKDVTDWIEAGYTLDDLYAAFYRASDLNNGFDFHNDFKCIYRKTTKKDEVIKQLIGNFTIQDGRLIQYVEEETQGVKLIFKSANNNIIEKTGPTSVFDDTKSFKNFLGSMDLTFYGNINTLNDFKTWINNNYLLDTDHIYNGDRFIKINNKLTFVTATGAARKDSFDSSTYAEEGKVNLIGIDPINTEDLKELKGPLLNFLSIDKTIAILGTIINNMAVNQNMATRRKLHHLLIVGESGSGKSTIIEKLISPFLNYEDVNKKTMGSTNFAMLKDLCSGNYTALYDEFKPSMMSKYKLDEISGTLRDLYDRGTREKGNKIQKIYKYEYQRPIIIGGEESFPNGEKALVTRSCIVYVSKAERTAENSQAMAYLERHQSALNSLGKSIIDIVLNLSDEEYDELHEGVKSKFHELKDRPHSTACNIAVGIELFNKLLKAHKLDIITDYEHQIVDLIKREVLGGQEDAYSVTEQMLLQFDDMVGLGKIPNIENLIRFENGFLYMHTGDLIARLTEFVRNSNAVDLVPIKPNDFKKQAKLAKYIVQDPGEGTGGRYTKAFKIDKKTVRLDRFNIFKLRELGLLNLVDPDAFGDEVESKDNKKIIPVGSKNNVRQLPF